MKNNLIKIVTLLKKQGQTDQQIKKWFDKPQEMYLGLTTAEFISISPKKNSFIVLTTLKGILYGEAMGS